MLNKLLDMLGDAYYYAGLALLVSGSGLIVAGVLLQHKEFALAGLAALLFGFRMVGELFFQLGGMIVHEAAPVLQSTVAKGVFLALILPLIAVPVLFDILTTRLDYIRWFLSSFLFLGGIGVLAAGYMTYWKRSLVRDTPTSRIRSLAIGPVELKGNVTAADNERIVAPLSGKECLLYEYKIRDHDPEEGWRTVDDGAMGFPFLVDDGTGSVLVDPDGAELYLRGDMDTTVPGGEDLPSQLQQANERMRSLANRDLDRLRNLDDGETMEMATLDDLIQAGENAAYDRQFIETAIQHGDGIYIYGRAREFEENEDRIVNEARLIIDGRDSRFFAIADMPEDELVDRLGTHTVAKIVGGSVIAVLGAAGLLWGAGLLALPAVLTSL